MSLQAHKRIQVSVPVAKSEYFHDLQNLRDPEDRVHFLSLLISMSSNPWHVVRHMWSTMLSFFLHSFHAQIIWPVVWVDEGADATQENLDLLKSMLVRPPS